MTDTQDLAQNSRFVSWGLLITIFAVVLWIRRDRRLNKMPGPGGFRVSLPAKVHIDFRDWASKYGEVFKLRVGVYNWVVINSPQAMHEILNKQVS